MKIIHNGVEWHGTFGVVLDALVVDLESDRQPTEVGVTYMGLGGDGDSYTEGAIVVPQPDAEHVTFTDGRAISRDTILALEVL